MWAIFTIYWGISVGYYVGALIEHDEETKIDALFYIQLLKRAFQWPLSLYKLQQRKK